MEEHILLGIRSSRCKCACEPHLIECDSEEKHYIIGMSGGSGPHRINKHLKNAKRRGYTKDFLAAK